MPIVEKKSYRLTDEEVRHMWGLSRLVLSEVMAGVGAAIGRRELPSSGWEKEFYALWGAHKERPKMFLGFAQARPLGANDRVTLGKLLHVSPEELRCDDDPVALYEVSHRLETQRREMGGRTRTWFADRLEDAEGGLSLLGMSSVQRLEKDTTLRLLAWAARLEEPRAVARRWAAAWPLAVKGAKQ